MGFHGWVAYPCWCVEGTSTVPAVCSVGTVRGSAAPPRSVAASKQQPDAGVPAVSALKLSMYLI